MDLLVVGGSGYLGGEVVRQARQARHRVTATFHHSRPDVPDVRWRPLDIRHRQEVVALAEEIRPDVILNAAYRQSDWVTTADGGMHVAAAAAATGARLVHVSSEAVFSGTAPDYDESCVPDPTTPYGAAKAAAETAAVGLVPAAVLVRTSLIIGYGDSGHEKFVHGLAAGTKNGVLFTDEIRCPVHVTDLAAALLELATGTQTGVHHVGGPEAISRHELGLLIARRDGLDGAALPTGLRAHSGVAGPTELRLNSARTQAGLATRLRGAREFLSPNTESPNTDSPGTDG